MLNKAQLCGIARKLLEFVRLDKFDLDGFQLQILIPSDYYDLVKHNFPERHPIDLIFGIRGRNWTIDLMRPYFSESWPNQPLTTND